MSMCYWCQRKTYCQEMYNELYKSIEEGKIYCENFTQVGLPNISMAWTTPAWVTENKGVTRRNWATPTLRRFKKDATYLAWSKNKMYGGEPLGIGRMVEDSFRESTSKMTDGDYTGEGFHYLDGRYSELRNEFPLIPAFERWRQAALLLAVVPSKIVEVFPSMKEKYTTDEEIIRCVKALVRALP